MARWESGDHKFTPTRGPLKATCGPWAACWIVLTYRIMYNSSSSTIKCYIFFSYKFRYTLGRVKNKIKIEVYTQGNKF